MLIGDSLSARFAGVSAFGSANRARKIEAFVAADIVITSMAAIADVLSPVSPVSPLSSGGLNGGNKGGQSK